MSLQISKTPVMVLQELAVKKGFAPPEYILVTIKHDKQEDKYHFKVNVGEVSATAFGRCKQVAKQKAASEALKMLAAQGVYNLSSFQEYDESEPDNPPERPLNFIGNLTELCLKLRLPSPIFTNISDLALPGFTIECDIPSVTSTQAVANSKREAKQLAAKMMLEKIEKSWPDFDEKCRTDSHTSNRILETENFFLKIKIKMLKKHLTLKDFEQQLKLRNKESLDYICEKLGIQYKIKLLNEKPPMTSAEFYLDRSFTIMAGGVTKENSEVKLIKQIFLLFEVYIKNI